MIDSSTIAAALRRMRDEIDTLLAGLGEQTVDADLLGLTMGAAAQRVLAQEKRPMRAPEIWTRLLAEGYRSRNGSRANVRSVSWALTLRQEQHGDVEKIATGWWKARP